MRIIYKSLTQCICDLGRFKVAAKHNLFRWNMKCIGCLVGVV